MLRLFSLISRRFRPVAIFLLSSCLLNGCGGSDRGLTSYASTIREAKAAARDAMAESGASALTLALVDGKGIIWTEALGYSDKAAKKSAGPETAFGIGSISKMFATIAVMKLVEDGMVSLDAPLATYLPQFSMASPEYRNVTVRMLLNHSSGFPGGDLRNAITKEPFNGFAAQMMDALKYQRLKHSPGYMNVYSNDGFTMVENLVKELTGIDYTEYVRQEILSPLQMNNSRYTDNRLPDGSYVKTYTDETPHPYASMNYYATGGLYSSATDMSKLMMMLINGGVYGAMHVLSSASIRAMSEDQTVGTFNPLPSDFIRFGLGWDTVTQAGLKASGIRGWQKGGAIDGPHGTMFRSTMIIAPDAALGVFVAMASNNISSDLLDKIGQRIMLRALVDRGMLAEMPAALLQNPLPTVTPTAEEKNDFRGFHAASGKLYRLSFSADNSMALESWTDDGWTPIYEDLKKRTDGWYASDGDSLTALCLLTSAGRRYIAIRKKSGAGHYTSTKLLAQKLDDREAVSSAWQARINERWLPINDDFWASYPDIDYDPCLIPKNVDGLPGYLIAGSNVLRAISDDRLDGMFLQIPQLHGRDLVDAFIEREGDEFLRFGSYLYRSLNVISSLPFGSTSIDIGAEGYSEWRKLPVPGSISISNAGTWRLFNNAFQLIGFGNGSGSVELPLSGDCAYLTLFGAPGTRIDLNLAR